MLMSARRHKFGKFRLILASCYAIVKTFECLMLGILLAVAELQRLAVGTQDIEK